MRDWFCGPLTTQNEHEDTFYLILSREWALDSNPVLGEVRDTNYISVSFIPMSWFDGNESEETEI